MDFSILNDYSFIELKLLCSKMSIEHSKNKTETIDKLTMAFREYEEYKNDIEQKYTRIEQLGDPGKEGITYLVRDKSENEYAMKTFKKSKSHETLRKEAVLQQKASVLGVAPVILEYDTVSKFIVMEKMDKSFIDIIRKQKGIVTKNQQKQIINLFQKLDECKVFHGDANIMNYMQKGKRLYMIDYGFSKEITPKFIKLYKTETPNMKIMLLGLILKLKELRCNPISWELLITYISEEDKIKCDL